MSVSTDDITKYVEGQEKLIDQLQGIVDWQAQAINRLMTYAEESTQEGVAREAGTETISDEFNLSMGKKPRTAYVAPTDEEKSAANAEWSEPTEEEERNFMSVKPWLGAMAKPDNFEYGKTDGMPDVRLELEHVHGYRTRGCRNNIAWVDSNTIVYFAAGVGIVHDLSSNTQKFFRGHDDDIVSLAYHPEKGIVATGQLGKNPKLCVWNVSTCEAVADFAMCHKRAVVSVSFNADGTKIASVGLDDEHTVAVHDVASGSLISATKGDSNRILDIQCNMTRGADSNNEWVSVGVRHIYFWTLSGSSLSRKRGILGNRGEQKTFLTVAFTTAFTCVGTSDGEIYLFKENQMYKPLDAHQKHLYSLKAVGDTVYSGGKDGYMSVWNASSLSKVASINMNKQESKEVLQSASNSVRAIDVLDNDTVLVGTIVGCIYKVNVKSQAVEKFVTSHYGDFESEDYGELWGCATHPSKKLVLTCGDDRTVRIWDVVSRKMKSLVYAKSNGKCAAFNPEGTEVAVGLDDGTVDIFTVEDQDIDMKRSFTCSSGRRVQCISYSPCGSYLAVGTARNLVYVYNVKENFRRVGMCRGNSSVILHLDFSKDSKYIQTCSQAYELLFYETASTDQYTKSHDLKNTEWATFTSTLGWDVQGIWPAEADGSDINGVCRSHSNKYLATAEDTGNVKVFNYPCVGGGLDRRGKLTRRPDCAVATGHSSHVTSAQWTFDDDYVITTGGADLSVFQWKVVMA